MKSRSKKAFYNIIVLLIYEVVAFMCNMVLPRYILLYFGSTYNGIISSITQFLGYISVFLMGIAGSTRFALYKSLADDDTYTTSGIINATERYMRKVGLGLIVYIIILSVVFPYISNSDLLPVHIAALVVCIGINTFAQYFFGTSYQILLTADQSQYIYNVISIASTIANTVLSVVLMKTGADIFTVKLGSAVVFFVAPIALSIIVRKKYSIDRKVPSNKVGLKGRWDVMWHSIANIVHKGTDLSVLTVFSDAKTVSVYAVYYLVIRALEKILSVFTTGLEAAFGNMFAKKQINTVNKHLDTYEFIMFSFIAVVFTPTLLLIVPFVKLYTTGITDVNYIEPLFAVLAVITQLVMCIRQPYMMVVEAAGHYKQTRKIAIIEAIINISLSVLLTFKYGLVGVTIGTLAANLYRTARYVVYLKSNILQRSVFKVIKMGMLLIVNMGSGICISQCIISKISINSWGQWCLAGGVCFVVSLTITLVISIVFWRKQLKSLKTVLYNMMRKKNVTN